MPFFKVVKANQVKELKDYSHPQKDKAISASNVSYDSSSSPLSAVDVQGAIDEVNNKKIDKTSIVDNLTTNDAAKVLSAKQGKALKDLVVKALDFSTLTLLQTLSMNTSTDDPTNNPGTQHTFTVTNYANYDAFYVVYHAFNDDSVQDSAFIFKSIKGGFQFSESYVVEPASFYSQTVVRCPANSSTWSYGRAFKNRGNSYLEIYGIKFIA